MIVEVETTGRWEQGGSNPHTTAAALMPVPNQIGSLEVLGRTPTAGVLSVVLFASLQSSRPIMGWWCGECRYTETRAITPL